MDRYSNVAMNVGALTLQINENTIQRDNLLTQMTGLLKQLRAMPPKAAEQGEDGSGELGVESNEAESETGQEAGDGTTD